MKNIFRRVLVGVALSELYGYMKKKGVFEACRNGCNDFITRERRKRGHAEYRAGKDCNYFGE
ncbi:MAG: hypothetical protein LBG19_00005 [Prevotellaceae bacterium]|jgi:hypothetical protein|nr:hypothetical protein [Prevotellaceae bacterium]